MFNIQVNYNSTIVSIVIYFSDILLTEIILKNSEGLKLTSSWSKNLNQSLVKTFTVKFK